MRGVGVVVVAVAVLSGCAADDGAVGGPGPQPTELEPSDTSPVVLDPPVFGAAEVAAVSVVDGDTLDVGFPDGRFERVRIIGINTPEDGECLHDEATDQLNDLVLHQVLRLRRDVTNRDQYDRLLRYVSVGGASVGEAMVESGLAISRPYPPDTAQQAELDAAQARAERAGVGLWDPDGCGRASTAAVVVGDVRPDPPGDESQTPNEEWVEILSTGGAVDLTGWGVQDESSSHRFTFPAGFRLAAGAAVRIHTGCGPDTETDLHWCVTGSAVWNNDGDTVFLTDPAGNIHDQRSV